MIYRSVQNPSNLYSYNFVIYKANIYQKNETEAKPDRTFVSGRMVFEAEVAKIRAKTEEYTKFEQRANT